LRLDKEQRKYLMTWLVISPAMINFLANGGVAWLLSRLGVNFWAEESLAVDTLLTLFLVSFLTALIVRPIIHQVVRQGDLSAVSWSRRDVIWLRWLPAGKWTRAVVVGLVAAILGGAIILGLGQLLGIGTLSATTAIIFKATYTALLAAIITPILALAALADFSQEQLAATGHLTRSIPLAQLPANGTTSHVKAMQTDMIAYLEHIGSQGDLLRIPLLGPVYAYFVNDPEIIRDVLVKKAKAFHKPANVKRAAKNLNIENIFTADGELWQVLRRVMQPAFHTRRIENYATIMVAYTRQMVGDWPDGQAVDIPDAMMELTLAITTRALFGKDMRDAAAAGAIVRFIELFYGRISTLPVPGWLPTRDNREMKAQVAIIEAWLAPMIAERKAAAEPFDDVLSMLIEAQKMDETGLLTDHQVRTEVMNLFVAGYEVVANTLTFTLYLVSQYPLVAQKIQAELDDVLGSAPVSLPTLDRLTYLDMVLKESMRLLPVTTVLSRQTAVPVELGGYTLPKDRLIFISPWVFQRDAANFPAPLQFEPERFDVESGADFPKYAYLPFSSGPRICLGNTFAMMQMKINLATIWQQVQLTHAAGHTFAPHYAFNTRPKDGLPMVVHRR
jgi:cytochrome P450